MGPPKRGMIITGEMAHKREQRKRRPKYKGQGAYNSSNLFRIKRKYVRSGKYRGRYAKSRKGMMRALPGL